MTFIAPAKCLSGKISLSGDKSVSHRLVLYSLLHSGSFEIHNLSTCEDVKTSLKVFSQAGGRIENISENRIRLFSPEAKEIPEQHFFCGNSGTTARLLAGILSGKHGNYSFSGDESLSQRPMRRIFTPLTMMGAEFVSQSGGLPFSLSGKSSLKPVIYDLPMASAQVKSAILLAATRANGLSRVTEPSRTRDHTERLLKYLGADIQTEGNSIAFKGPFLSTGHQAFEVPGDASSAAFLVVAALLIPGSNICIENVLLNPTRTAFLKKLKEMGAKIEYRAKDNSFEPSGDIKALYSENLQATTVHPEEVASLIDELPALAIAMAKAKGISKVTGASELRVKESDRIKAICDFLGQMNVTIEESNDGYSITGTDKIDFDGTTKETSDHRIAAAMTIAALASKTGFVIPDTDCIGISFPDFFSCLSGLKQD